MRIVIASDKFKGTLTAGEVADALSRGIARVAPAAEVVRVPVADGGDGTLAAFIEAGFERVPVEVTGPTGTTGPVVRTAYARRGKVAVIELADASGLARLPDGLAPLSSTTIGTGELLAAALDAGCSEIVLGVGGSASTDGGLGMLVALGAVVHDAEGRPVTPDAHGLQAVASLDLGPVRTCLGKAQVVLAVDVDNPLLGADGAAAVFGPQKGAAPEDIAYLALGLTRWADLVAAETGEDHRDDPGAGAAGGTGFAALAVLGAKRRSGIDVVLDLVDFDATVAGGDLVVTGEGALDEQSLRGKAPIGVLRRAFAAGVPTMAVCGQATITQAAAASTGFVQVWSLSDLEPDLTRCMRSPGPLLERVGELIATRLGEGPTASAGGRELPFFE